LIYMAGQQVLNQGYGPRSMPFKNWGFENSKIVLYQSSVTVFYLCQKCLSVCICVENPIVSKGDTLITII
jgi:hypothetical protein